VRARRREPVDHHQLTLAASSWGRAGELQDGGLDAAASESVVVGEILASLSPWRQGRIHQRPKGSGSKNG
jgi:hypothetical protein